MVYCSETSPGSDSGVSEEPNCPAPQAPGSPALYEVVYEAGALQHTQQEAGPTFGLISIQIGQCTFWKEDNGLFRPSPDHVV